MKKYLCILLAAVLLFLCSCTAKDKNSTVLSPVMKEYLLCLNNFETPVREYGEERSKLLFGEKMVVGVFYPEVGITEMDDEIKNWVEKTVALYQKEVSSYKDKNVESTSELTVSYESFYTNGRLVSVKMSGFFDSPFLAHPIEIIETFIGNTQENKLVEAEDLFESGGKDKMVTMITEKVKLEKDWLDDELLDKCIVTENGIEIILPQGQYMPMSDGTKTVHFSCEELKGIVVKELFDKAKEDSDEDVKESQDKDENEKITEPDKIEIDKTKPMVALTFDDGPSAHTDRLLDIFAKHSGRGTFFVVGNIIDNRKETVKRIVSDGHEIAGHSWNHRQLTNLSDQDIKDQIMSTKAKIYELTGYDAKLIRPPYGAYNDRVRSVAKNLSVSLINWSVDTLDWKNRDAETVYKCIMEEADDGAIVLCHDLHKTTVDAMEKVIPALIDKGYQLVTVSELIQAKGEEIIAGKVYFGY